MSSLWLTLTMFAAVAFASVEVDADARGTIAGDDFARAFFRVWLAPDVPHPKLRDGLLGRLEKPQLRRNLTGLCEISPRGAQPVVKLGP